MTQIEIEKQAPSRALRIEKDGWQAISPGETAARFGTDPKSGLSSAEANERLAQFGPNRLHPEETEPFWEEFLEELREPMVLLLVVTGIIYALWGEILDALTIFLVILALNTIEVVNEQRAKKAIASLRKLAEPVALVLRDGSTQEVPAEGLVPGDVILLQDGRRVPADARLLESYGLAVDESALTGESIPAEKEAGEVLAVETPLAEQLNSVFSGTLVRRGHGSGIVTATGMASQVGQITGLARQVKEPRTPLQQAMDEVSKSLVGLALGLSVLVPLLGVLVAHQPFKEMVLTGLSLAFATIPEEMPIIITMVLGLGGYRLSKEHAIVKHLKAVETLGAVTVIATDKTGTLTENRLQVALIQPPAERLPVLRAGLLSNTALYTGEKLAGDPLEIALAHAAQAEGLDIPALESAHPRLTEFSFDNQRKRMSIVTRAGEAFQVWAKGAPESILAVSDRIETDAGSMPLDEAARGALLQTTAELAGRGLRVIALAAKKTRSRPASQEEAERELTFLGLAGLADPPRPEAAAAIQATRRAGIRSILITGDHPLTARAIAEQVGLDGNGQVVTGPELDKLDDEGLRQVVGEVDLFARTTPEHKLRIVQALQARGERVAVTGDGINDAPALVAADIGVAMGESGSDVAREAGDIVLSDDNYTTIANAIREGRVLFENLKKGVRYYLAVKVALVSVTLLPVLLGVPVPFAPVQIILMELFMDLAAAAAFVAEPAEGDLMRQPPRDPRSRFMDGAMIASILTSAAGLFAAVSIAYLVTYISGAGKPISQTVAFVTWLAGHVLLAFNMRSERQPVTQLGLFSNRLMVLWAAAVAVFLLLANSVPLFQAALKTSPLTPEQWLLALASAIAGTFWLEIRKLVTFR